MEKLLNLFRKNKTVTRRLKTSKATEKEIDQVKDFIEEIIRLNDISLADGDSVRHVVIDNKEDLPILYRHRSNFTNEDSLLQFIGSYFENTRYDKVFFNLYTLLENCADPKQETLEFNKDITRGLELLGYVRWFQKWILFGWIRKGVKDV